MVNRFTYYAFIRCLCSKGASRRKRDASPLLHIGQMVGTVLDAGQRMGNSRHAAWHRQDHG